MISLYTARVFPNLGTSYLKSYEIAGLLKDFFFVLNMIKTY